ncbi:MAG: CoA pyrophosphatase, partial [Calditrichaeota bacterium]|nr:CoA pyrophosphatase [Calditrichota bacterium]
MNYQQVIVKIQEKLGQRAPQRLKIPEFIPSAIILPLFEKNGEAHILLTVRTDTVAHHKGQVSCPGGAWETQDASLEATALRETEEEVGIPAGHITL